MEETRDEQTQSTRVDLGEDLLAESQSSTSARPRPSEESVEELLLNAKILLNEGLVEEAKKTLRRVLKSEPGSLLARERLEEIQKLEIKKLLSTEESHESERLSRRGRGRGIESEVDIDRVRIELERNLGESPSAEKVLFGSPEKQEAFIQHLLEVTQDSVFQDRIDLAVALIEMELFDCAIPLLKSVQTEDSVSRQANSLLCMAYIEMGNGFEAMVELERLVADQSFPPEEKVDYGYLAGRAQELLGQPQQAAHWYQAVLQIVPGYRDADVRLRKCLRSK